VLQFWARTTYKPILKLFSLSISSSVVPSIWKDVQNYKGISKLFAIPKTFKRIITSHLQHLCSSLISTFVKRRSTTTNLLDLTSFVKDRFSGELPLATTPDFVQSFNIHVIWGPDYGKNSKIWLK